MRILKNAVTGLASVLVLLGAAARGNAATWSAYVIRGANSDPSLYPTITSPYTDSQNGFTGTLFAIVSGGQKAGWGTDAMNGLRVGDIQSISIERDPTQSGGGPYMNFWVKDSEGHYAVLANEPSNTSEWTGSSPYDTTWDVLKNATVWVYEADPSNGFKLPNGTTSYKADPVPAGTVTPNFTFADFADYTIAPPLTAQGGTGAPDDLEAAAYTAYGTNWIFGDTQTNYVPDQSGTINYKGYLVANPTVVSSVAPVPEPLTIASAFFAVCGLGTYVRRRRRAARAS